MTPAFAAGAAVRIRPCAWDRHHRVPRYVQGRAGTVLLLCGAFPDPEALARGEAAAILPLYRVGLPLGTLWPEGSPGPADTLEVEVFESCLDPA